MAAAETQIISRVPRTKEDVMAVCFSPDAISEYEKKFPELNRGDISDVLAPIEERVTSATVFPLFPPLIEGRLRSASHSKQPTQSPSAQ